MIDDRETRTRLLATATRLFADQGFKKVTVREICHAARANVAAVNYHFGDKLGLYREVVQQAIEGMVRTNEAAREAGEGQPAEEKLRRFIVIFLSQIMRPEFGTLHRLVQREMQDPTPVLDALVAQGVKPRLEYLSGVVAEMIGGEATDAAVLQCVGSINAQAIIYLPNAIGKRLGFEFRVEDIDSAAEHIASFSIAGVRAIGRRRGRARQQVRRRRSR